MHDSCLTPVNLRVLGKSSQPETEQLGWGMDSAKVTALVSCCFFSHYLSCTGSLLPPLIRVLLLVCKFMGIAAGSLGKLPSLRSLFENGLCLSISLMRTGRG